MFDGITIKSRLTIAMAFLCLLLTGAGMLGLSSIGRVNASLKADPGRVCIQRGSAGGDLS
ncbi:Tar ligand binding domain-containing protein [Paraburkholderia sp. UCT2]|uniref:Tar ligand binding domain-containing protein n=1 Tax=Paraburkholderia sp. UCT2 TaxID=2615208 RepID=UPI00165626FD|nr:Tar ligand binding domain-containing protein [Paraburkholderia sp. UCT2]MBC8727524.1 hypothetical protein [Paraburkholderia sp. UCT2]